MEDLEVRNASGKIVFNARAPNLMFHSKGLIDTAGCPTFTNQGCGGIYLDVPQSISAPVIAFGHHHAVTPWYALNLGNGFIRHVFVTSNNAGSVPYYIFDAAPKVITPSNFGIQLKDSSDNITFSTNGHLANVVAVNTVIPVPAGRVYAAALASFAGERTQVLQGDPDTGGNGRAWQTFKMYGAFGNRLVDGLQQAGYLYYTLQQDVDSGLAFDFSIGIDACFIIDVTPFA